MTSSVLGIDIQTGQRVDILQASRRQGMYIIGANGTGKTGLIENLIIQDIQQGLGVCLLDPHGDLTKAVLSRIPDTREHDVIYLDIADQDYPFGFNLFACNDPTNSKAVQYVIDQVMHIFEKLFDVDRSTPLLTEYLRNCTHTLVVNPGYTMADIPKLFLDEACRKKLVANVTDTDVKLFWQVYEQLKPNEQREDAASTLRRVWEFLQPLTRNIVGQSRSTIDLRAVMDERKILLVKLDARLPSVTSLIGSALIALLLNAAYSRADIEMKKRKQFTIYADEFQRFATEDFATLLTEARKFGIATTIAHQMRDQLDGQNKGATLNVANLVVFKISGKDAEELSAEFDSTPPPPEITGWRPILTPKQDVIEHLKKNGHIHPDVSRFLDDYLLPMLRTIELHTKTSYQVRVSPRQGLPRRKVQISDLDEACHQLNRLFFSIMTDRDANIPIPPFIFFQFARLFGFSGGLAWYFTRWSFWTSHELPSIFYAKQALLLICAPDCQVHMQELTQMIPAHRLSSALAFTASLRLVMQILASDPILINTGQHEPIFDKPRTYQDVQNEIATRFANLPKFTARVKTIDVNGSPIEYTVKTITPERGFRGVSLQDRIDRIRANNIKDGYCRQRAEVEEEIRLRQEQCRQSIVASSPPPPSRRVPITQCPNCGAQYRLGAKFCSQCQQKL